MKSEITNKTRKYNPTSVQPDKTRKLPKSCFLICFLTVVAIIAPLISFMFDMPIASAGGTDYEEDKSASIDEADDYEEKSIIDHEFDVSDIYECDVTAEFDHFAGSFETLSAAVVCAPKNNTEFVIEVKNDFAISSEIVIPKGSNIILISSGDFTLTTQGNYRHFNVIGTFTLTDGITLTNYDSSQSGGGIKIRTAGVFIMNGGTISGNHESLGGGVLNNYSTFIMKGGKISGNFGSEYGGGVYNSGIFVMEGGEISGNDADYGGGGVFNRMSFRLLDGTIHNNSADLGGGVLVRGPTTISGGTICDNIADEGGGVCVDLGSSLEIKGGVISDNIADLGGGIGVYSGSLHTKGGKIDNNKAGLGGGVYVNTYATYIMEGGRISNNKATGSLKPKSICNCCRNDVCEDGIGEYVCLACNNIESDCDCIFGSGGGIFTTTYNNLSIGKNAVFSGNKAGKAYGRDPAYKAIYKANVQTTSWTEPFSNGFNNFDINSFGSDLHDVRFKDWDNSVLKSVLVSHGDDIIPPVDPSRSGYVFTGWLGNYSAITEDRTIIAQYKQIETPPPVMDPTIPPAVDTPKPPVVDPTIPPAADPSEPSVMIPSIPTEQSPSTPPLNVIPPATKPKTPPVAIIPPINTKPTTSQDASVDEASMAVPPTMVDTDGFNSSNNSNGAKGSSTTGSSNTSQQTFATHDSTTNTDRGTQTTADIAEQETALTGNAPYITIGGKNILLFAPLGSASWAFMNLVLSSLGVILAVVITIRVLMRKRSDDKIEYNFNNLLHEENRGKRYGLTSLTTVLILCIAGIILYLLTQDRLNTMVLTDIWTPIHAAILAAETVCFILVCLRIKKKRSKGMLVVL